MMKSLLGVFAPSIFCFILPLHIYPQDASIKFNQQSIEIQGEVDNVILRDLNNDKLQEVIFQQGHNLVIYNLLNTASGAGLTRSSVYKLPDDVCIYDITETNSNGNIIYINNKGINLSGILSPTAQAFRYPCRTIFRNEIFPAPLRKRIMFDLACSEPFVGTQGKLSESNGRNRAVVVPANGKFLIVPYGDILSGVITQTEEVPVAVTSRVYNSASIFEPLATDISLPVFAFADLNNDKYNDFITLAYNNICGFISDKQDKEGRSTFLFKPAGNLLSIPEDAANQEIDFGYTLSPIISDINKDGYADIIFSDDREGTVYIYLNQFSADGIFFAKTPTQIIRTNNWIIEHNLIDLNGDSLDDLVLVQMNKLGVMGGLQAILAKTLEWEVVVYLARPAKNTAPNGRGVAPASEIYPKSPDYVRSIKLPFSFSYSSSLSLGRSLPKIQSPYIWSLAGDFNGDRIRDLLLSSTESQMGVYPGDKQQIFNKDILASFNLLSANQGYKLMGMPYGAPIISDINNDGKSDIIIPLTRQDSAGIVSCSYDILLSN
ncbi:MAG: VCBS repeat-containing protein [Planctomycetota bacterium]